MEGNICRDDQLDLANKMPVTGMLTTIGVAISTAETNRNRICIATLCSK